jgi:hypothetical protein
VSADNSRRNNLDDRSRAPRRPRAVSSSLPLDSAARRARTLTTSLAPLRATRRRRGGRGGAPPRRAERKYSATGARDFLPLWTPLTALATNASSTQLSFYHLRSGAQYDVELWAIVHGSDDDTSANYDSVSLQARDGARGLAWFSLSLACFPRPTSGSGGRSGSHRGRPLVSKFDGVIAGTLPLRRRRRRAMRSSTPARSRT